MAQILDGKLVAQKTRERLRREVAELAEEGIVPGLAVVLVGNDVGSQVYVRNKTRACEELGIRSWQYNLPDSYRYGCRSPSPSQIPIPSFHATNTARHPSLNLSRSVLLAMTVCCNRCSGHPPWDPAADLHLNPPH